MESIHWGVETGLSAQIERGRLMYGVSAHLCSAGLDKTSVWIRHSNMLHSDLKQPERLWCNAAMKWSRKCVLTNFVQMMRQRLPRPWMCLNQNSPSYGFRTTNKWPAAVWIYTAPFPPSVLLNESTSESEFFKLNYVYLEGSQCSICDGSPEK